MNNVLKGLGYQRRKSCWSFKKMMIRTRQCQLGVTMSSMTAYEEKERGVYVFYGRTDIYIDQLLYLTQVIQQTCNN